MINILTNKLIYDKFALYEDAKTKIRFAKDICMKVSYSVDN